MIKRAYGLIGYPLTHSYSGKIFKQIFNQHGIIDAEYRLMPITSLEIFNELIRENPILYGLNVTIPYKEQVIPRLNDLSEEAAAIGAVNCIKIFRDRDKILTKGYNTDYKAFLLTLKPHLEAHHRQALVLGTGGAARAVAYALKILDIKCLQVSRRPRKGELGYRQVKGTNIDDFQIIINATPTGMHPVSNIMPELPYEHLNKRHLLYDLVYNPELTQFLSSGKKMGAKTINGTKMLQLQAELSWEIWNKTH
jgi:shikimate dehydrogenase